MSKTNTLCKLSLLLSLHMRVFVPVYAVKSLFLPKEQQQVIINLDSNQTPSLCHQASRQHKSLYYINYKFNYNY